MMDGYDAALVARSVLLGTELPEGCTGMVVLVECNYDQVAIGCAGRGDEQVLAMRMMAKAAHTIASGHYIGFRPEATDEEGS